jgi:hypothetical protein
MSGHIAVNGEHLAIDSLRPLKDYETIWGLKAAGRDSLGLDLEYMPGGVLGYCWLLKDCESEEREYARHLCQEAALLWSRLTIVQAVEAFDLC